MPGREPIPLHRAMPVLDAFRVIARDCLQRLSDQAQQFGDIGGAEPLHQCRVAIRQLRAALALFQPALSPGGPIRFQIELRWIMGQLGDARNLDALLARFFDARSGHAGPLLDRMLVVHEAAYAQANAAITSHRMNQLVAEMTVWLNRDILNIVGRDERIGDFADRALSKRWRRLRGRARRAVRNPDPAALHRLRIELKKMRYTANFLAPLYADDDTLDAERFRKRMAKAQDRLGAINDLVVAETIMENVGLATRERQAADLLLQEAREARKALIQRIPRRLKKLRGTKPFWRR